MDKTFCDKCENECGDDYHRVYIDDLHYLYTKGITSARVTISELILCPNCKELFAEIIEKFI